MRLSFAVRAVMVLGLVGLALAAGAGRARAQGENKAAAEAAFRQGRDLMGKGEYAAACMAFRSSQQLDPQLGTQYNLGLCYEQAGMFASAWGELTNLAARDTNAARRKDATKRAAKLEPRLVKLLIVVRESTAGLAVKRDGKDVTPLVGVATPVDPGTSVIEADAPGFEPFQIETSLVGEGTTVTLEIPPLTREPIVETPDEPEPDRFEEIRRPPPEIDRDPGKGRRRLGIIVGVIGVAALAGGATFAVMASSANQDARDLCEGDVADCRGDIAAAQEQVDSARSRGTFATIGLGVGAAAVVTGAILYFTAADPLPAADARTTLVPTAGPSHLGLALAGRF